LATYFIRANQCNCSNGNCTGRFGTSELIVKSAAPENNQRDFAGYRISVAKYFAAVGGFGKH
jgi:hypothetical protein